MTDKPPRLEIDWLKTIAGALAAVSSAVLLSTLGAAGTIIGAAIGSVVLTTASALYSQGLARSRYRLAQAQSTALRKVGIAQAEVRRAGRVGDDEAAASHLEHADERLGEAQLDLEAVADEPATLTWRERLTLLPWRRIALYAAGLFVVAILTITAFELITGRTVSSYTGGGDSGGTTITRLGGGGDSSEPSKNPTESPGQSTSPDPTATPSGTPDESASPSDPGTDTPTSTPTTTPSDPGTDTPTSTVTPTVTPTADPTASPVG